MPGQAHTEQLALLRLRYAAALHRALELLLCGMVRLLLRHRGDADPSVARAPPAACSILLAPYHWLLVDAASCSPACCWLLLDGSCGCHSYHAAGDTSLATPPDGPAGGLGTTAGKLVSAQKSGVQVSR